MHPFLAEENPRGGWRGTREQDVNKGIIERVIQNLENQDFC